MRRFHYVNVAYCLSFFVAAVAVTAIATYALVGYLALEVGLISGYVLGGQAAIKSRQRAREEIRRDRDSQF